MGRTVMIFAAGSRGDVQPCLALGKALTRRGDAVRLLASTRYRHLNDATGVDFHPLSVDPADIIGSAQGQELLASRSNPAAFIRSISRILRPRIGQILEQTRAAAEGADLVLAPTFGFLGVHLSQYLRVPHAIIHFQPSQPTGMFPHPMAPAARLLGALGNRLSFDAVDVGSWLMCRPFINSWRLEHLGLPPMSSLAPFRQIRRAPVLCAFSPTIVPRPPDWGPNVHVTGFWHHDQPLWKPPQRLLAFLAGGPPPVYVGFGSMKPSDLEATDHLVRAALRHAGLRGVLAGDPATSEDDFLVVSDTAHDWLFPRMAAVVHHGGAGTTASALRAGVPSLVCPFFGDQAYWAARVRRLGAGPQPLPFRQFTIPALAQRLRELTQDPGYAEVSRRLGRAMRTEGGVAHACEVLNQLR
ncbi:glycosyltransferase [Streptomyces sp. NPDC051445]|uniref:glycosyltransferase n=1 Tax=Streptomyces sp. NPDC051445 TaxID=3365653 RepID=UPI0037B2B8F2